MQHLQFKINGEYITQQANELLKNGEMKKAMKIIHGCTLSDQLSEKEHNMLIYDILEGRARIKGTYPEPDYGVVYPEDKKDASNIADVIKNLSEENEKQKEEAIKYEERLSYILEYLQENHSYVLSNIAFDYQDQYDEPLFKNYEPEYESKSNAQLSNMLESFLERAKQNTEDDYGWLEPNGKFHPVEWGLHNNWAENYLMSRYSEEERNKLYYNDEHIRIPATDVMIYKLNWILLHNPSQGLAQHTAKPGYPLTKPVKEFLFDYYSKRKQYAMANAIQKE